MASAAGKVYVCICNGEFRSIAQKLGVEFDRRRSSCINRLYCDGKYSCNILSRWSTRLLHSFKSSRIRSSAHKIESSSNKFEYAKTAASNSPGLVTAKKYESCPSRVDNASRAELLSRYIASTSMVGELLRSSDRAMSRSC